METKRVNEFAAGWLFSQIFFAKGIHIKNEVGNVAVNNIVEQDHRFIKKITKPMLGFKSFLTAEQTLKGIGGHAYD
jgi:transposase-like protein